MVPQGGIVRLSDHCPLISEPSPHRADMKRDVLRRAMLEWRATRTRTGQTGLTEGGGLDAGTGRKVG